MNDVGSTSNFHVTMFIENHGDFLNVPPSDLYDGKSDSPLTLPQGTTQPISQKPLNQPLDKQSSIESEIESLKAQFETRLEEIKKRYNMEDSAIDMSRTLSDEDAEIEIRNLIERFQSDGRDRIGILDIIIATNLPSDQIERIMNMLFDEGVESVQ
jgi:hypothetical protein